MIDHDFRLEDERHAKPNYVLRRVKFTLAVIGFVVSVTLLLTWQRPDSAIAFWIIATVFILTAVWLVVRFAPREDDKPPRGGGL